MDPKKPKFKDYSIWTKKFINKTIDTCSYGGLPEYVSKRKYKKYMRKKLIELISYGDIGQLLVIYIHVEALSYILYFDDKEDLGNYEKLPIPPGIVIDVIDTNRFYKNVLN